MAKAYNIRFGVYYETWGGKPFSNPLFNEEHLSEWGKILTYGPFETTGPNGGSSRSLHRRILYYSYLSNADFIADEWGLGNMFYDWKDFKLTPYGQVRKNFLEFVRKYPQIGEKQTPIAVVLPKEYRTVNEIHAETFVGYTLDGERKSKLNKIKEIICKVFSNPVSDMQGDEIKNLINSDIPDAVDLIHEDSANIDSYEYLIDATLNPDFALKHNNICKPEDIENLLEKILPCYVEGGLHWMVNKADEKYYLAIFNHSGIRRNTTDGDCLIEGSEKVAKIKLKNN